MLWSVIRLIFKTSSVTPDFFYVFNIILSFSTCSQSFKKICAWELLGANVLKHFAFECYPQHNSIMPKNYAQEVAFCWIDFVIYDRLHKQTTVQAINDKYCSKAHDQNQPDQN